MSRQHPKIAFQGGVLRLNFGEYGQSVEVAAIDAGGRFAALVRDVGVVEVWDVASSKQIQTIRPNSPLEGTDHGPRSGPFCVFIESVDLAPDGEQMVLGLNDGSTHVYETLSGNHLARIKEPIGLLPRAQLRKLLAENETERWKLVRCVRYSSDGKRFAIGHFGSRVSVWDSSSREMVAYLQPETYRAGGHLLGPRYGFVTSVDFSLDSSSVFAGTSEGAVFVWDLASGLCLFDAMEHTASIVTLHRNEMGLRWATSLGTVYEQTNGDVVAEILRSDEKWQAARFSPSGNTLLVTTQAGAVRKVDLRGGEQQTLVETACGRGGSQRDNPLAFGNEDEVFAYPCSDSAYRCHSETSVFDCELEAAPIACRFSFDGSLIATESWKNDVRVWRTASGECVGRFESGKSTGDYAISPDNRLLAIGELGHGGGCYDRDVRIYDLETREMLHRFVADDFQILGVAFLSETRLVTKSSSINLWDLRDGRIDHLKSLPIENHSNPLRVLKEGPMLRFSDGRMTVFDRDGNELADVDDVPSNWDLNIECFEPMNRVLIARRFQQVSEWDFVTGQKIGTSTANIPRPQSLPSFEFRRQHRSRSHALLWQVNAGRFLHQGDAPRGWIIPMRLSNDRNFAVIPCEERALIVAIDREEVVAEVPFEGHLRASVLTNEQLVLLNSEGNLFRYTIHLSDQE
ncbi:MAG: WD40 repeat domain-containing protein [Planctomycetota bacterium]